MQIEPRRFGGIGSGLRRIFCAALLLTTTTLSAQMGEAEAPTPAARDLSAGHGTEVDRPLLAPAENPARTKWLHTHIMCACPEENWSRTLANCPDACANPQKGEIQALVAEGKTNEQIIEYMVQRYGTRARSSPGFGGTGKWAFILPVVALIMMAWFAGVVVRRWKIDGASARVKRRLLHEDIDPDEIARIERDLESLE